MVLFVLHLCSIEEAQNKEYQRETGTTVRLLEASNFDVMADNTAIVTCVK
jgi:hypothetical protein